METRQIVAIENKGKKTLLTVTDLEEGPLYGIPPNRPLGDDFHSGDIVTIADREKYEIAEVVGVDEHAGVVKVSQLLTPPGFWILDYDGSHPPDLPETPDNFTLPLCYLRKHIPLGTPVYYWSRIDDEWDIVHAQHGRRLQVNFSWVPLDLSSEPVPADPGGHGSISPPKDYLQWHDFVREIIFHVIDRYGAPTLDFYYSVGNEHNFPIFWSGGKDGFYELYDYTVNAILTAFEDRGMDASQVQVGGLEAAYYGGRGWTKDALYHCSGAADKPGGGIQEYNYVCSDPRMVGKRAARVEAICAAHGGKGSPIDFASMHEYRHSSDSVSDMNYIRDQALAMDPTYYEDLNVTCFECTPDWIPRIDPASGKMYEGNGFFPTWCADWMQRMVARAESDNRYARHETVLTVWPFDYNGQGLSSITGLIQMDDDGDGTEDRIATIKKGIFNYIELLAHMNRDLDALPAQNIEGIRFAGVRSPSPDLHRILLYNHDKYDTESSEETEFTAQLSLSGIPWTAVKINRWRVDRDHSSPYHAYQDLPAKSLYAPEDIVALEESDDLVEDGLPQYFETSSGSLNLDAPLRVNGVTLVEMRIWDEDQDNVVGPEDCNDDNDQVWSIPGEALNLQLVHDHQMEQTDLAWNPPNDLGGTFILYDTLRSSDPSDFETGTFCLESNGADTASTDTDPLEVGDVFYYLIRAENDCPSGHGSLGSDSEGMARIGRSCP
jgi:beta-xylosidase